MNNSCRTERTTRLVRPLSPNSADKGSSAANTSTVKKPEDLLLKLAPSANPTRMAELPE